MKSALLILFAVLGITAATVAVAAAPDPFFQRREGGRRDPLASMTSPNGGGAECGRSSVSAPLDPNSFVSDAHAYDLWRFDGASPFTDEKSRWPLTDTGTASTQVAGKILFARHVNSGSAGTSDPLDNAIETIATGEWTLEAWVNSTASTNTSWHYILSMSDAAGNNEFMSVGIHNGALFAEWVRSGSFLEVDGVTNLRDGLWHRIAVVKTLDPLGSGKYTYTFWVDGVLDATSTLQNNTNITLGTANVKWRLFTSGGFPWVGEIDEIRFSDIARAMP